MWRVSTVLELAGISTAHARMDEHYRVRGTAVHDAAEALAEGYTPAQDEWSPWTDGVAKFFADHEPRVVATERRIIDRFRRVTGKLDLVTVMFRKATGLRPWVIDFKTGSKSAFHTIQLGGYHGLAVRDDELWALMGEPWSKWRLFERESHLQRGIVYLPGDHEYKFVTADDPRDSYLFNSALALLHYRHEHGLVHVTDEENPDNDPKPVVIAA